ncbi:MAG: monovalent cation/H(+) antiporter subunit G [Clostridia bacterium]|nr:monovalent cation/H(+) antiporter subunit G [Clostridia bacterium]
MLEWARFVLSALLLALGLFVLASGVLGVFRFRQTLSRVHAAALVDTLGIASMFAGLIVAEGFTPASLKLLAVVAFLWLTSPVSSHLIGRMEVTVNDALEKDMRVDDPEAVRREKEGE